LKSLESNAKWSATVATLTYASILLFAEAANAQPSAPNWGETLRLDAAFIQATIAANHPGPVDREHPEFMTRPNQA
jgi:hypothetical protein